MEVAERIGFLSAAKLIELNKLLEKYGLGRIGLKKERTKRHRAPSKEASSKKVSETKKKRIEKMVEMANELNKK